jgi:hypothetical protein
MGADGCCVSFKPLIEMLGNSHLDFHRFHGRGLHPTGLCSDGIDGPATGGKQCGV